MFTFLQQNHPQAYGVRVVPMLNYTQKEQSGTWKQNTVQVQVKNIIPSKS